MSRSRTPLRWARSETSFLLAAAAAVLGLLGACGPSPEQNAEATVDAVAESRKNPLVIYSGRNQSLIDPLLERFDGADVKVVYGATVELVAALLKEGAAPRCDIFLSQDAPALGALSKAGKLKRLPDDVLARIPARFTSPSGDWVGLSGRARTVVYNPERIQPRDLPQTLDAVTDPRYRGTWGLAPVNASFQAHMAVYRALRGEPALKTLLDGMVANEPKRYAKNSAIVDAVARGEIDWGLVNHHYLWRALQVDPEVPGKNMIMSGDAVSGFLNLAGAAMLSERPEAAELMRFLVSDQAQDYFSKETFEYPLARGLAPTVELQSLDTMIDGQIDFAQVSENLGPTLAAIAESGLVLE